MSDELDLGHDHKLRFTSWSPDRDLNPQYDGIDSVEKFGAIVDHLRPDGTTCSGGLVFDSPTARALGYDGSKYSTGWTVENWEPLTISPSVLCKAPVYDEADAVVGHCEDHGFIRNGKWEPA